MTGSKQEAAQRASYAAELARRGARPPGRNGAYDSGRGPRGNHPASIPPFLRKRVLFPLFFVVSVLGVGGYMWWTTPVAVGMNGDMQQRGQQILGIIRGITQPDKPLQSWFNDRNEFSVLMVGLDHVPSRRYDPNPPRRSDSVLLATTDLATKQIRLLSIPRDGWVEELNSKGEVVHDKLAHSYSHGQDLYPGDEQGGIRNTADAVGRLLGIQPDYFVVIQFDGLAKLINALGGLEVDVEKRMKYNDNAGDLHIDFQPGPQHMTGEQVVQYARFRHDVIGDIGRMGRQQKVIMLILDEIKKPENFTKLPQLLPILHEVVLTNFTLDQLMAFAQHMKDFPHEGMQTMTLQSYGNQEKGHRDEAVGVPRGMSVQVIEGADVEAAKAFLQNLQPPPPPAPEGSADGTAGASPADAEGRTAQNSGPDHGGSG